MPIVASRNATFESQNSRWGMQRSPTRACSWSVLTKLAGLTVNLRVTVLVLGTLSILSLHPASATAIDFGSNDVRTVFSIEKSSNRNRVDIGLRLDDECRPWGEQPAFIYWRMLESGADEVSDLNAFERRGYGILSQTVTTRGDRAAVYLQLIAVPDRLIQITVRPGPTGCDVRAKMTINGERAWLRRVFLNLSGFANLTVDSLELHGLVGDRPVMERIEPR